MNGTMVRTSVLRWAEAYGLTLRDVERALWLDGQMTDEKKEEASPEDG